MTHLLPALFGYKKWMQAEQNQEFSSLQSLFFIIAVIVSLKICFIGFTRVPRALATVAVEEEVDTSLGLPGPRSLLKIIYI